VVINIECLFKMNDYISRVKTLSLKLNPLNNEDSKHIHPFFRTSSFIPVNIGVCYGLLTTKTIYGHMFWQILNQTYNVGFNYANRSKNSNPMTNNDIIKTYTFAVASSCTVSGMVSYLFKNISSNKYSHFTHTVSRGLIPFTGVFLSSTINLYYVRKPDIDKGISVYDTKNLKIDDSNIAAKNGFYDTAFCRSIFRFVSCMFPPLIEYWFLKNDKVSNYMKSNPNVWMFSRMSIISTCLYISMPLCFTIIPNQIETSGESLEDRFHEYEKVRYDRGM